MNRTVRSLLLLPFLVVAAAACALRLGGPSAQSYHAAALHSTGESAAAVAERIRQLNGEIVLLSSDSDSAWFGSVAAGAGLTLSGPGRTGPRGMAFLTNLEILGDTSLVLDVTGGGQVHMHDALYRVDERRVIDLMMVRLDAPDLRAAIRTLLGYIATDVGSNAAILLAIEAASPQLADSATVLMRATLGNSIECAAADQSQAQQARQAREALPVRLLYGPSARMQCLSAQAMADGVYARVRLQR
jgi:hypothetical protein